MAMLTFPSRNEAAYHKRITMRNETCLPAQQSCEKQQKYVTVTGYQVLVLRPMYCIVEVETQVFAEA